MLKEYLLRWLCRIATISIVYFYDNFLCVTNHRKEVLLTIPE